VFVLTSFSQTNVIKNTTFYLYNGTTPVETGFTVAVNPTYPTVIAAEGTMVITFNNLIDFTNITSDDGNGNPCIDASNINKLTLENGSVYGITFNYVDMMTGNVFINYNPNTVFTFITEQDTIDAYYNGVNSVNVDSVFNAGWNGGYDEGVIEGENTSANDAYEAGYTAGENSTTGVNTFAVTNLNVFPNPANTNGSVEIQCDGFNNVRIFTITGQEVGYFVTNIFNVNEFTETSGTYLLRVEDNDYNVTNSRLLVQK